MKILNIPEITKSICYTKEEVDHLIGGVVGFSYLLVDTLPVTGDEGVIYLKRNDNASDNLYDEFLWVNGDWEIISSNVDLSDYVTQDELDGLLDEKSDVGHTHSAGDITGLNDYVTLTALMGDDTTVSYKILVNNEGTVVLKATTTDDIELTYNILVEE